jgi:2-polyprenyl-6-hydroxyphenyl methylase/3-demethylubiquinone-9 3-methyltransferase
MISKKFYYSEKLSAERLKKCYEIAPERVKQYLKAEIDFVVTKIRSHFYVLELGSGYGRILQRLAEKSAHAYGIDLSLKNLLYTKKVDPGSHRFFSAQMNADNLAFAPDQFDTVLCLQNGISAFKVDPVTMVKEAIRVVKSGGFILLSSYSDKFWKYRLEWFQIQSDLGLVGEIDYEKTGNGIIICKDGFKATTYGPKEFMSLALRLGLEPEITEVDCSSIFCMIRVP